MIDVLMTCSLQGINFSRCDLGQAAKHISVSTAAAVVDAAPPGATFSAAGGGKRVMIVGMVPISDRAQCVTHVPNCASAPAILRSEAVLYAGLSVYCRTCWTGVTVSVGVEYSSDLPSPHPVHDACTRMADFVRFVRAGLSSCF